MWSDPVKTVFNTQVCLMEMKPRISVVFTDVPASGKVSKWTLSWACFIIDVSYLEELKFSSRPLTVSRSFSSSSLCLWVTDTVWVMETKSCWYLICWPSVWLHALHPLQPPPNLNNRYRLVLPIHSGAVWNPNTQLLVSLCFYSQDIGTIWSFGQKLLKEKETWTRHVTVVHQK